MPITSVLRILDELSEMGCTPAFTGRVDTVSIEDAESVFGEITSHTIVTATMKTDFLKFSFYNKNGEFITIVVKNPGLSMDLLAELWWATL